MSATFTAQELVVALVCSHLFVAHVQLCIYVFKNYSRGYDVRHWFNMDAVSLAQVVVIGTVGSVECDACDTWKFPDSFPPITAGYVCGLETRTCQSCENIQLQTTLWQLGMPVFQCCRCLNTADQLRAGLCAVCEEDCASR